MRGHDRPQATMLTVVNPEKRVPANHPIRLIKALAGVALKELSPLFEQMYSEVGRPSIPPERLLKASLLMALYTVRSERMFCEQLDYNLLFRWFLDLNWDEPGFDHSSFSRNRARLLEHDVAGEFFRTVVAEARELRLTSDEYFTVDGTLIEAWASLKSFKRKDEGPTEPPDDRGNPSVNFHGQRRQNATHQSTTDPEAKLAKKGTGKEAKLCYSAHALMENRNTILIDFQVEPADGYAERRAAIAMVGESLPGRQRITLGGDKGYDTRDFVESCRALKVTPHVAQNLARPGGSAIDARTVRHPGYAVSQWIRKRVEETFGWMKTIGGLRRTRYRGRQRVQMHAYLVAACYNLLRIAKLNGAPA
ncbi:MAG TPA: IS5 family transposase [Candidatus Acidoferrum sp.]|nr:IS5 family transposase [Candidatus Acidoferrum sp.]